MLEPFHLAPVGIDDAVACVFVFSLDDADVDIPVGFRRKDDVISDADLMREAVEHSGAGSDLRFTGFRIGFGVVRLEGIARGGEGGEVAEVLPSDCHDVSLQHELFIFAVDSPHGVRHR